MQFNTVAFLIIITFLQFHTLISAGNTDVYGYLGCYNVSNLNFYPRIPGILDIEVCRTACFRLSSSYNNVFIHGSFCYCANEIMGLKVPEFECDTACAWNSSQICGGSVAASAFTSRLNHTVLYVVTPTPVNYYSQLSLSYRRIDVTWMYASSSYLAPKDSLITIDFFNTKDRTSPLWTFEPPFPWATGYFESGYPYYSSFDRFNLPNTTEAALPAGHYVAKVTRKDDSLSAWSQEFSIIDFPTLLSPLNGTVVNESTPLQISWKSNFPELPMSLFYTYYRCGSGKGGGGCGKLTVEAVSNLPTGMDGMGSYTWNVNIDALEATILIGYTDYKLLKDGVVVELIPAPPNTNTDPSDETANAAIKTSITNLTTFILISIFSSFK